MNFMEKGKTRLRKLKRAYVRKKKTEKARKINKAFQQDPGRAYPSLREMASQQADNERPKYEARRETQSDAVFENIEQAASHWKALWESEGTGNKSAEWLEEVRQAIAGCVPESCIRECDIEYDQVKKVIVKKRNWIAPGPDRIVNYWWKRMETLHESVGLSFRKLGLDDNDVPLWFTQGKTSLIPKPSAFSSDNTRPITCLNTIYKWYEHNLQVVHVMSPWTHG